MEMDFAPGWACFCNGRLGCQNLLNCAWEKPGADKWMLGRRALPNRPSLLTTSTTHDRAMNCDNTPWPNHSKSRKEKQSASADKKQQKSTRNRKLVGTTHLIGHAPRRRFQLDNPHSSSQSETKLESWSRGLKTFAIAWECEHQVIMI